MIQPKLITRSMARKMANNAAGQGVGILAYAFNTCDDPRVPYRYSDADQEKFKEVVFQIIQIIEEGEIELLDPQLIKARNDPDFQRFLASINN